MCFNITDAKDAALALSRDSIKKGILVKQLPENYDARVHGELESLSSIADLIASVGVEHLAMEDVSDIVLKYLENELPEFKLRSRALA
jgi:hypothetical protein